MAIEAVAVVRVPVETLRETLELTPEGERLTGNNGMPYQIRAIEDGVLLHTQVALRDIEPDELGFALRQILGDALDRHDDERGVLVFPSGMRPSAKSYDGLVDEVGEMGEWVPKMAAGEIPRRMREAPEGSLGALISRVATQLGPELGDLQRAITSGEEGGMQRAVARVQEVLLKNGGLEELMSAFQGVDVGAMQQMAEATLKNKPELEKQVRRAAEEAAQKAKRDGKKDG